METEKIIYRATGDKISQSGSSLLMIITSFSFLVIVGALLLKISHYDLMSSKDYSAMATAAISARSSLLSSKHLIENEPQLVRAKINRYLDSTDSDPSKEWFIGTEDSFAMISNQQKYHVKITGFDKTNHLVQIQGVGYGKSGSKKNVHGVYYIKGFKSSEPEESEPYALYIGKVNSFTLFGPMKIDGSTYISGDVNLDQNASGSIFYGPYRTGESTGQQRYQGHYTFDSTAYFGTKVFFDGSSSFTLSDLSGFENGIYMSGANNNISFGNNSYFNDDASGPYPGVGTINSNHHTLTHNGSFVGTNISLTNKNIASHGSDINITELLDFNSTVTDPVVNIHVIPESKRYKWSEIRNSFDYTPGEYQIDEHLSNLIHERALEEGNDWNGFSVVEVDQQMESVTNASSVEEIKKDNGGGFYTTISSVIDNGNSYTITLTVVHDGCTGKDCKELSHYSVEANAGSYSNVSKVGVPGNIDLGPNLGDDPFSGFKIDNTSGIGDGKDGSFTITYTLNQLQDQQMSAKAGTASQIVQFYISDFQKVLDSKYKRSFLGKMIFVVKSGKKLQPTSAGKFYKLAPQSLTMIYVENGGTVQNLGGWGNYFRGYIYCSSGGTFTMGGAANNVNNIYGAVHFASGSNVNWYPLTAQNPDIIYDYSVFEELSYDNLVPLPTPENVVDTLVVADPAVGLEAQLRGLHY